MAEASVLSRTGPMQRRTAGAHAERMGMPFMAQCTVNEFPYQRMHRFPTEAPRPLDLTGVMESSHRRAFQRRPMGPKAVPAFTVGRKNELGTSSKYRQVSLDDLRQGQITLGDQPQVWCTSSNAAYKPPDQACPLRGLEAPRTGMAVRLPFSELGTWPPFATGTSVGIMPGKTEEVRGRARTEHQTMYERHKPRAREQQMVTMGQFNDIGSSATYRTVPAADLQARAVDAVEGLPREPVVAHDRLLD